MVKINPQSIMKRQENVVWKNTGKDVILLDLKTGDYFTITETGFFAWKMLNDRHRLSKIVSKISDRYAISQKKVFSDLKILIKGLHKNKLINIYSPSAK